MPFTLDNVVPWGRSLDEYVAMFALSEDDLSVSILGCADGPASFNAEMHDCGRAVISADPIYGCSPEDIRTRIDQTYPKIMEQLNANLDDYVWERVSSPSALGRLRSKAMDRFLADFNDGKATGRYVACELPALPFDDRSFDLALCSHFLFLYSDQLSAQFHCQAIRELLRVAGEIRIFPLLTLGRQHSPHLDVVCAYCRDMGRTCAIETVDYEFQRGGNQMLRVG